MGGEGEFGLPGGPSDDLVNSRGRQRSFGLIDEHNGVSGFAT